MDSLSRVLFTRVLVTRESVKFLSTYTSCISCCKIEESISLSLKFQCPFSLMNSTEILSNTTNTTQRATTEEDPYHYLHKISYAWYTMIGWAVVVIIGSLVNVTIKLDCF